MPSLALTLDSAMGQYVHCNTRSQQASVPQVVHRCCITSEEHAHAVPDMELQLVNWWGWEGWQEVGWVEGCLLPGGCRQVWTADWERMGPQ